MNAQWSCSEPRTSVIYAEKCCFFIRKSINSLKIGHKASATDRSECEGGIYKGDGGDPG